MTARSRVDAFLAKLQALAPGILMALTIAAAATFLSEHYGAPVMLFALLIGMIFHFLSISEPCAAGIQFTASRLLKIGVALLGARVSMQDLLSLGPLPLVLTPVLIVLTMLMGAGLAKIMGRSIGFGILTGGAVAICGASAALAIGAVLPARQDGERDILFTVIAVTSLSTLAMIVYPVVFTYIGFNDQQIGYLIGATIHDVAQVVGAGYGVSDDAGAVATFVKLLRVALLPVVVIAISLSMRREADGVRTPFPWFAVGFAVILIANSLGVIAPPVKQLAVAASTWLLVAAIAALGMKTSLQTMARLGARPIAIIVGQTLFLCAAALVAVRFL